MQQHSWKAGSFGQPHNFQVLDPAVIHDFDCVRTVFARPDAKRYQIYAPVGMFLRTISREMTSNRGPWGRTINVAISGTP